MNPPPATASGAAERARPSSAPTPAGRYSAGPPPPHRRRQRRPERSRRVLPIALGLSVLFHLVLFVIFRLVPAFGGSGGAPTAAAVPRAPEPSGMRIVRVVPTDAVVPEEPEAPETPREQARPTPRRPTTAPTRPQPEAATSPEDEFQRAVEALRTPRIGDPRLWGGNAADLRTPTERAALRAYARMNDWNDSTALAQERARHATDWTFTDSRGRRWGVSPGKLHLGDITLPLPVGFSPSPYQRELIQKRINEWDEIQAQAAREEAREIREERAKAIRERKDAERGEE